MKTQNRQYWQKIEEELEEAVSEEISEGCYDESKIPDLEDLASQCPFKDLSEKLLGYARVIECHITEKENGEQAEETESYIDVCLDL